MSLPRIAPVIRIRPNPAEPGGSLIVVKCPFCHEPHVHEVPWQDWQKFETASRDAPCVSPTVQTIDPARYFLRTPAGLTPKK